MTMGAGTEEYTVGSIIDRMFATYLTPPDNQYAQFRLATDIQTPEQEVISVGTFTLPEDENLLRQGSIIEQDQELMRVTDYDPANSIAKVTRGEYGTIPTFHSTKSLVNLSPPYPRAAVFEAVSDNIIQLYPRLFTANAEMLSSVAPSVYSIGDDLAVAVLSVQPGDFTSTEDIHGTIVDFHPSTGGRALITNVAYGTVWLRYRRRMAAPESEQTTLAECGVNPRWANLVMVGASADIMVGRDIPASKTEWVTSVLEAENIRVGTRMSIAGGMRQYYNLLMERFEAEMKAEYRPTMRMRPTMRQVSG